MFKRKPQPVKQRPTPQSIIDEFVNGQHAIAGYHRSEIDRLEKLISDATARLANHKRAYEAVTDALTTVAASEPIEVEPAVNPLIMFDQIRQTIADAERGGANVHA